MLGILYTYLSDHFYNSFSLRPLWNAENGMFGALFKSMKPSFTLLAVLTAAATLASALPVKAERVVQAGPTAVSVPDAGSTISLLGLSLLSIAALRRKLGR
jgi:hypothetical protein